MNEILQSLKEGVGQIDRLCSTLVNAVNYANNITKEGEEKLKQVEVKEKDIAVKTSVLDSREAKVSKVEDIVALEKSAKETEKKNALALDNINEARLALEKTAKDTLRNIAEKEAKLADENEALTKGWESLRAKEKSYRAEIEDSIMKRFKK